MTIDGTSLFLTIVGVIASGILSAFGWWVRGLVLRVDQLTTRVQATDAALAAHKLWASENYVKQEGLKNLRDDLIAHFDRLERNVHAALERRADRAGAE